MNNITREAQQTPSRHPITASVLGTETALYAVPLLTLLAFRLLLPATICDDAYISFKVADNLASGFGMVFNPDEHIYVSTSPLWVLLLAAGRLLLGDVVVAAKVLGWTAEALLTISLCHVTHKTTGSAKSGMFAGLFLITNPVYTLTSFSGMELPLFLLAITATGLFLAQRRYTSAILIAAACVWIRFDGITIFAAACAYTMWHQLQQIRSQWPAVARQLIPGALLLLCYVVFGFVFFETCLPMSVQRKALTAPRLLSPEWIGGAIAIAKEFINAILGRSWYWYYCKTPFLISAIPLCCIGTAFLVSTKRTTANALLFLTAVLVAAFTASGSSYAIVFPWYFAPILPASSLLSAAGLHCAFLATCRRFGKADYLGYLYAIATTLWLVTSLPPLYIDAHRLVGVEGGRERIYATAAIWAGKHRGNEVAIGANEIGAIGFFLPREARVLDMFGLLSTRKTLGVPFVQRIRNELPDCIFTKQDFSYKAAISLELPDEYEWFSFRDLDIGIRSDLVASLEPCLPDFELIYESINMRYRSPDTVRPE